MKFLHFPLTAFDDQTLIAVNFSTRESATRLPTVCNGLHQAVTNRGTQDGLYLCCLLRGAASDLQSQRYGKIRK